MSKSNPPKRPPVITRFELIDETGRVIVFRGKITSSLQDSGRTLKVFIAGVVLPGSGPGRQAWAK